MRLLRLSCLLVLCAAVCFTAGRSSQAQRPEALPKSLEGHWLGALQVGTGKLRLVLNFKAKGENAYVGTMDSIDQGAYGLTIDEAKVADITFTMELKKIGATFEGQVNANQTEIAGIWKQSKLDFPVTFKRLDKKPDFSKPQEPKKPYPYKEEEVVYENAKAKLKLAATLTLPKGEGPFPAVVLITGSGPQDRDEAMMGHRPFLVLADHLTRQGIAVLRADDRGVGKSTGQFFGATTADFVDDALAGVAFLKGRAEIDAKKIGLVGHSEGGVVAPMASVQSKDVAYIVLLAGTGCNGEEIIVQQTIAMLKAAGAKKEFQEWNLDLQKQLLTTIRDEPDDEAAHTKVQKIIQDMLAKLPMDEAKKLEGNIKAQMPKQHLNWTRYFIKHDPRTVLRMVSVPVLAVCGELDMQVLPQENLPEIEKALKAGGNKDFTIKEFTKLNHLFQTAKTGAIAEYGTIDETMAPVLLQFVSDWILARTKK